MASTSWTDQEMVALPEMVMMYSILRWNQDLWTFFEIVGDQKEKYDLGEDIVKKTNFSITNNNNNVVIFILTKNSMSLSGTIDCEKSFS